MHDPDPWREFALGDVASITVGGTPSTAVSSFWGGDVPWMASGDVNQRRIIDVPGRISALGLRSSNATLVDPPSVAIGLAGQGKTRGTAALVERRLCTNQSVALISGDAEHLLTSYLFHDLDRRYEELRARSSGGGRGGLSKAILERIPLRLPSVREQSLISRILDTVDDEIVVTERLIAKLEQMSQGLLHDLLTCGLNDNGTLRDPFRQPERFRTTALGLLPDSWEVRMLQDVADVARGKFTHRPRNDPAYYGGGAPFIQTGDIAAANGSVITQASQSLSKRGIAVSTEFPAHTIAVTIAANIADTAILGMPMFFPDSVVGVQCMPSHSARYVQLCISAAKPRLEARAPQSAQKNINLKDLRPLLIPVPSQSEQMAIVAIYEAHAREVADSSATREKLALLKVGLMNDLLSGRVRVTADMDVA
ncbi:MAG TPA: restriction endonuclease subunit S [Dermatophilaceae bacterium]